MKQLSQERQPLMMSAINQIKNLQQQPNQTQQVTTKEPQMRVYRLKRNMRKNQVVQPLAKIKQIMSLQHEKRSKREKGNRENK
jgi:hypothetical protein